MCAGDSVLVTPEKLRLQPFTGFSYAEGHQGRVAGVLVLDTVKRASIEVSIDERADEVIVVIKRYENDPTVRVVFV